MNRNCDLLYYGTCFLLYVGNMCFTLYQYLYIPAVYFKTISLIVSLTWEHHVKIWKLCIVLAVMLQQVILNNRWFCEALLIAVCSFIARLYQLWRQINKREQVFPFDSNIAYFSWSILPNFLVDVVNGLERLRLRETLISPRRKSSEVMVNTLLITGSLKGLWVSFKKSLKNRLFLNPNS